MVEWGDFCVYASPPAPANGSSLARSSLGGRWGGGQADQVQFVAVEQFPLDLIAGIEADGRGEGQRETDVEPRLLSLRADGLDLQRIGGWHVFG